jgi:selenium metabolism protein YedF
MACPQPVILTRKALQENELVTTIVDTETAQHNVTRMAEKNGAAVRTENREDGTYLHIATEGAAWTETITQAANAPSGGPLVLTIPSDIMGRGDEELGHILIRGFLHTLSEVEPLPDTIIFLNSGVKLVAEGSPVVDDLRYLCGRGVEILACGTCLGHYELKDDVAVGEVSNMYTIAETLLGASRTISL